MTKCIRCQSEIELFAASNLRALEFEQGFTLLHDAPWLNKSEWREIVLSQDGRRLRIVLLDALHPGQGAFTRLIEGISNAGLVPVLVEPSEGLIEWCHRHDYRTRIVGKGRYRHEVWYPRRSAY